MNTGIHLLLTIPSVYRNNHRHQRSIKRTCLMNFLWGGFNIRAFWKHWKISKLSFKKMISVPKRSKDLFSKYFTALTYFFVIILFVFILILTFWNMQGYCTRCWFCPLKIHTKTNVVAVCCKFPVQAIALFMSRNSELLNKA